MATQGRQEPQWWLERQGASLSQKARDEFKTSPAGRRLTARLLLCKDGRDEKEVNIHQNRQRPRLTHKQEPTGMEVLK